jgi:hypothetical protein
MQDVCVASYDQLYWTSSANTDCLVKGEVLTRHFAQNWGAPYKFGVTVLSKAFSDAPDCILRCLQRLRWAGREAVKASTSALDDPELSLANDISTTFIDFNELLSLGYMEADKINVSFFVYHIDIQPFTQSS